VASIIRYPTVIRSRPAGDNAKSPSASIERVVGARMAPSGTATPCW
jgi:hypothetical protein